MSVKASSAMGGAGAADMLERRVRQRVWAGAVALCCAVLLGVAAYVEPSSNGIGTHTQLGMQACGFYERTGYPCVTCGMTTAFAHVVRGQLGRAFAVQPAGTLAGLAVAVTAVLAAFMAVSGSGFDRCGDFVMRVSINWVRVLLAILGVVLGSWAWLCAATYFRGQ